MGLTTRKVNRTCHRQAALQFNHSLRQFKGPGVELGVGEENQRVTCLKKDISGIERASGCLLNCKLR